MQVNTIIVIRFFFLGGGGSFNAGFTVQCERKNGSAIKIWYFLFNSHEILL